MGFTGRTTLLKMSSSSKVTNITRKKSTMRASAHSKHVDVHPKNRGGGEDAGQRVIGKMVGLKLLNVKKFFKTPNRRIKCYRKKNGQNF